MHLANCHVGHIFRTWRSLPGNIYTCRSDSRGVKPPHDLHLVLFHDDHLRGASAAPGVVPSLARGGAPAVRERVECRGGDHKRH
jgi:hypothetical protein